MKRLSPGTYPETFHPVDPKNHGFAPGSFFVQGINLWPHVYTHKILLPNLHMFFRVHELREVIKKCVSGCTHRDFSTFWPWTSLFYAVFLFFAWVCAPGILWAYRYISLGNVHVFFRMHQVYEVVKRGHSGDIPMHVLHFNPIILYSVLGLLFVRIYIMMILYIHP